MPISITLCLVFDKQPGVLSLQSLYIGLEVIHVLNNCSLTQAALEYFDAELKFQFFKPLDLRRTSSSLLVIATNFLRNCLQCLKLKFLLVLSYTAGDSFLFDKVVNYGCKDREKMKGKVPNSLIREYNDHA